MRRAVFIIAGGAILLLALKVFLFEFPQAGREQWHMYSFERGSSPSGSATGDPNPDFHDVQGDYVQRLQGGKLFVVRGTVASTGNGSAGGIRILAMLLSSHGKLLAEETVIAGNVIPDETLRTIDREAALKLLRRRQDRQPEHDRLPAGKFIPFTLVFFDPPEEIESFAVKKVDTR